MNSTIAVFHGNAKLSYESEKVPDDALSWITNETDVIYEVFGSSQISLSSNDDSVQRSTSRANSIWDTGNYGAPFTKDYNRLT